MKKWVLPQATWVTLELDLSLIDLEETAILADTLIAALGETLKRGIQLSCAGFLTHKNYKRVNLCYVKSKFWNELLYNHI